jgi:hypothetical protein
MLHFVPSTQVPGKNSPSTRECRKRVSGFEVEHAYAMRYTRSGPFHLASPLVHQAGGKLPGGCLIRSSPAGPLAPPRPSALLQGGLVFYGDQMLVGVVCRYMPRYVTGMVIIGMSVALGLAAFRFLDTRIKAPDEGGVGMVIEDPNDQNIDEGLVAEIASSVSEADENSPSPEVSATLPALVELDVPFVPEAPEGIWAGPWKNACEEASLVMAESFYAGQKTVSVAEAKKRMTELFALQDRLWGSNANSDAARTAKIANDHMAFKARVVTNPTVESIKAELAAGRPVISLNHGKELGNPNIPFLATGSFYHMLVIIGYDDATGEFITNDDGDEKEGAGRRYGYEHFMASVHDYIYATKKTDGPARMIFTTSK